MSPAAVFSQSMFWALSGLPGQPGYNDPPDATRGASARRKGERLARIVRPESAARTRERILQSTSLAIRYAATQSQGSGDRHDVLAFIVLALHEIAESVDTSATAWEKRGYWLKADRFRRDWIWVEQVRLKIENALREQDLAAAGDGVGQLSGHLAGVKIPTQMQRSTPWQGSWERWQAR
jgi:hypothetical protein